jgi:protoporphyrinogen oxidase
MNNIVILGAGMAGFGASYRFKQNGFNSVIFEKENYPGGKAASFEKDGFIFDDGPHISFTKDERIQQLFAESIKNKYETLQVGVNNYWKGYLIKHPAQVNLYGLPNDLVVEIINEIMEAKYEETPKINNFRDWLVSSFGQTFSETFPIKYGLKFHTTHASNMTTDWIGPRVYQPEIKEVLHGALSNETKDVHYVTHFRYPSKGGFKSYLNMFKKSSDFKLNHNLIELDPEHKSLLFENGIRCNYDFLVSSIPLPELISTIKQVPIKVLEASNELACSTCVIVNLGINRSNISKSHWSYFYDDDIVFTRLSYPHMQSVNNVPKGCGSIQVEIYFSKKYKPLKDDPEEYIDQTINDLIKCGLLTKQDKILFKEAKIIEYANVIFDLDRKQNLKIVHDYLDNIGIKYCGRYGEWGYLWTDESFKSGENAADKITKEILKLIVPK